MSPPKDMSYIFEAESVGNNMVITPVSPDPLDRAIEIGAIGLYDEAEHARHGGRAWADANAPVRVAHRALARAVLQAALTEGAIALTEPIHSLVNPVNEDFMQLATALEARCESAERERDAARAAGAPDTFTAMEWAREAVNYVPVTWQYACEVIDRLASKLSPR